MVSVWDLLDALQRPLSSTHWQALNPIKRLVVTARRSLWLLCLEFVKDADGLPILASYASDGTPIKTRFVATSSSGLTTDPHAKAASVRGSRTEEFLFQTFFMRRYNHSGLPVDHVFLREPLPLSKGKKAAHITAVCVEFNPCLRDMGHAGIAIQHYSFDGALFTPITDVLQHWHAFKAQSYDLSTHHKTTKMLDLTEWFVCTLCALHCAHNSLKWGLMLQYNDNELLKDVYLMIESLRGGMDDLVQGLPLWLMKHVALKPTLQEEEIQDLVDLWTAMGQPADKVELPARDLQLRWHEPSQKLWICDCVPKQAGIDCLERISFAITSLWSFQPFHTGRWCSVGRSCKLLLGALFVGLASLVQHIQDRFPNRESTLKHFKRMDAQRLKFVSQCAMASFISDVFLRELLEDSRVAARRQELQECMMEEWLYLLHLPMSVWRFLAGMCFMDTCELRSTSLHAAQVSFSFIMIKVLHQADQLPWVLCRGDIEANLKSFATATEPSEPTSWKIWKLLQKNYPVAMLVAAIKLLSDCPWCIATTEQQHAAAAIFRRFHSMYGAEQLRLRAFLHAFFNVWHRSNKYSRIWNPVREAALAQKLVPAVSVEWDLKHASFVPMDIEIDESMVKGFTEARKILVGELALRKKTRQDVMSALKKVHESCRMRDPFWKMVEDYLTQLGEDHGCAVLEAEYWECFTDKATGKPKSLQQLAKDLPELKKTVLWSWVPEDKQDHLATGMEVIYQMSLGEPPKWHSPTDFLITLQHKLPDLCIHYNGKKGKAAMADMLKHTQDAGDVQYLSFLHLFRWAFSNEQQTQLDEFTDKLMVDSDDDGAPSEESEGEKGASKKHASKNEAGGPAPKKMKANHQEGGSVSSSSGSCTSPAPAKFDQNVMQKTLQYFSGAGSI